jgi:cytochrome c oxidase assembly factor CtaG
MTTSQFFLSTWSWNPFVLGSYLILVSVYLFFSGWQRRLVFLCLALAVIVLALNSPLSALANGYLFAAHMAQHILLLLIAPIWILLSLPRNFQLPERADFLSHPIVGGCAGVGAMWLWHLPILCGAAVSSSPVFVLQTISLLLFGSLFWWPVLAPREQDRLSPLAGIGYLFIACTACSVLGIILTFAPARVCPIYMQPVDRLGLLGLVRDTWGMTPEKDQQIGGLLMWVPMCLIYLAAIFSQLVRWFSPPAPDLTMATSRNAL